jgi:hypothetical protein
MAGADLVRAAAQARVVDAPVHVALLRFVQARSYHGSAASNRPRIHGTVRST